MGSRRKPRAPGSGRRSPFVIGIVGRSSFYRQSLAHRIGQVSAFLPIDLGSGQPSSIARAREHDLDLVLIDLTPAEACRFSEELLAAVPKTRPVAVLDAHADADPEDYAEAGFMRFVATEASFEELIQELTGTLRDDTDRDHRLARLIQGYREHRPPGSPPPSLSRRERQILALLTRQLSNKEIASELGIEPGTVKNHVHHILGKMRLSSRWDVMKRGR